MQLITLHNLQLVADETCHYRLNRRAARTKFFPERQTLDDNFRIRIVKVTDSTSGGLKFSNQILFSNRGDPSLIRLSDKRARSITITKTQKIHYFF